MQDRGLLFIPDISGFTKFVNATDIAHSRLIIQELLEVIINSNQLGLEVSEVEGDAVLFYKFCDPPNMQELFEQIAKTFQQFHQNLISYDLLKYCQCNACMSAVNLSLKVITHYGEFSTYNVKHFKKLIGKDVIVAHQLLKNDIDHNEYWLATKDILGEKTPGSLTEWMTWTGSSKKTESGEIYFSYTQLTDLKEGIKIDPPTGPDLLKMKKVISVSHEYDTDLIRLFHATGDFRYRPTWMEGVVKVGELGHFLPRIGMRCHYVMKDRETTITSSSYKYNEDRIEFTETEEEANRTTLFVLEKLPNGRVRCTLNYYISNNPFVYWSFLIMKKSSFEKSLMRSLNSVETLIPTIKLPGT
jgi:hypothetical protein